VVEGICAKATNEVAIDLEIVEREMLQVIERAEPEPKSSSAKRQPRLLNSVVNVFACSMLPNRRRFGQLEDQTRGVDARVRERSIDVRHDLVDRGYADGFDGEDWLRAERQLEAPPIDERVFPRDGKRR
jgi:hypothetical protein